MIIYQSVINKKKYDKKELLELLKKIKEALKTMIKKLSEYNF